MVAPSCWASTASASRLTEPARRTRPRTPSAWRPNLSNASLMTTSSRKPESFMTRSSKPNLRNPRSKQLLRPVHIVGTGSYVPDRVLTNADLEKLVDTTDEWIVSRSGIKERRIAADWQCPSDLAVEASRRAMEQANVNEDQIDLIICATITPDMPFPATACLVQQKLGARRAGGFDMEAACSGFLYVMEIGQQF